MVRRVAAGDPTAPTTDWESQRQKWDMAPRAPLLPRNTTAGTGGGTRAPSSKSGRQPSTARGASTTGGRVWVADTPEESLGRWGASGSGQTARALSAAIKSKDTRRGVNIYKPQGDRSSTANPRAFQASKATDRPATTQSSSWRGASGYE